MTQYFVDNFQAADLSDFEQLSNLSHHTLSISTFDSKSCFTVTRDFDAPVSIAYTPAGTAADYEICALIRIGATANNERFGVAGNMTDTTNIDGYVCGPRNNYLGLSRIDNSSRTLLDSYSAVTHDATTGWVWYRLRKEGSTLKGRYWAELATEPATWQIDTTDPSAVLAAGKIGFLNFRSGPVDHVAALGIGTNGDTAPTAAVATGLTIDSTDASMQRNTNFQVVCSTPTTAPTTGNTTLTNGNDTLTPTSVTGAGPYTLTFPVGDLSKQVDATGYDWTLTVDAETATTGNIPLTIQAGYTKVDLVSPDTTNASLLYGLTGDAPVTGDDLEYDVTSVLDSGVSLSGVAATGVWTVTEAVEGDWVTDITVSRRVVQADGTIGAEAVVTLSAPTSTSSLTIVTDMVSNIVQNMVN